MIAFIQKLKNKKNKKGFTLVELIVVIAIIAILTAVLIPVIGNYTQQANEAADAQTLKEMETSFGIEISEMGTQGAILNAGTITVTATGTAATVTFGSATVTGAGSYDGDLFLANMGTRLRNCAAGTYTVTIGTLNGSPVFQSVVAA